MTVSLSGDMPINDQANPRYTTMGDSTLVRTYPLWTERCESGVVVKDGQATLAVRGGLPEYVQVLWGGLVNNVSLAISFFALAVSVYGIFERQRAAYSALRVRLTELLASIEELNVDELQYRDQHSTQEPSSGEDPAPDERAALWAPSGYASRRVLLTYQALDLLNRLHRSRFGSSSTITAAEHCSLATSLRWSGDLLEACTQWELAVTTKGFSPLTVRAASYRGLGETLFELGQPERARESFRKALDCESGDTDTERWANFDTNLQWIALEMRAQDGIPEVPVRAAYEVASQSNLGLTLLSTLREAAATTIYVDGQYRDVGLEDLLRYTMADLLEGKTEEDEGSV